MDRIAGVLSNCAGWPELPTQLLRPLILHLPTYDNYHTTVLLIYCSVDCRFETNSPQSDALERCREPTGLDALDNSAAERNTVALRGRFLRQAATTAHTPSAAPQPVRGMQSERRLMPWRHDASKRDLTPCQLCVPVSEGASKQASERACQRAMQLVSHALLLAVR